MKLWLPRWFRLSRLRQDGPPPETWTLEVQIHPSDIRRRVRYLFLTRRQLTLWCIPALVYLAFLTVAAWTAPGVIGGMLNRQEYGLLVSERTRQGERLQELVGRLEELQGRSSGLNLRMDKILLAYGLDVDRRAASRGRAADTPPPAPDSIYSGTIERGNRFQERIGERLTLLSYSLRQVRAYEQEHKEQVRSIPSFCPIQGGDFVLISPFGRRRSPYTKEFELHTGLDLAAPVGKPILSPADGTVVFAGVYPMGRSLHWWRFGNLVIVRNGDGFVTLFGHCNEIKVRAGQKVKQGDVLATVGNTGWSTSPHVHYEVRRKLADGRWVPADPLIYILDHRWQNEERLLLQARNAPPVQGYEPLPPLVGK
ncbi:MAG TPA: M23 family metallopeptidase [Thermoanaerobaculia bacterium]|jgi:murein DD-endopeptidase MepM/ murein hydrolase activator NlpD|nr:M23 family metallopeptidase [Thermoanaerobaculia bacterium]